MNKRNTIEKRPMQNDAAPLPQAITIHGLTDALRRSGVLRDSRVADVAIQSSRLTVVSRIIRLKLTYDGDAPSAPASLICKTGHPDRVDGGWTGAQREIAFYRKIASLTPGRYTPSCYEIHSDEQTKAWHLLLEDLTDTHVVETGWPLPPALPTCERIVDAHAQRQALCWDVPELGALTDEMPWRDAAATGRYLERVAAQIAFFSDRHGDRLPRERRELFARFIDAVPRLLTRFSERRNLTVVQGDAHVWNCFLPRDGGNDARFIDWDSWRIDVGASDLAYMMAMHWYPDRRHQFERTLLDRYHATLTSNGVSGYGRSDLSYDYRLSVLWQITWPIWQEAFDIPPVIWWNNLERIFLAVDDLDCCELL